MTHNMKQSVSGLRAWLLLASLLLLLWGLGWVMTPPSLAAIHHGEEEPGWLLYQSQQVLSDQHDDSWQAIAFKRLQPGKESILYLRLTGPETTSINQSQPLTLTTARGEQLQAPNLSQLILSETPSAPYVAQYDLQAVLPQLALDIPLQLDLPTRNGESIVLAVTPDVLREWQVVSSCQAIMCNQ